VQNFGGNYFENWPLSIAFPDPEQQVPGVGGGVHKAHFGRRGARVQIIIIIIIIIINIDFKHSAECKK
jgi:hypothetical protein